ncbi:hypothetical protein DW189_00795 [Alistipes sp. AM16-43]|nr:hypothetical protein DW189_00795 [Alistipes sp. AM16-43]
MLINRNFNKVSKHFRNNKPRGVQKVFFQDDVIIREGFVILKRNTERNDMYDFPAKYIGVSGFFPIFV